MPMPSLFKYFLTVGAALLGVLFLLNYLLEQPAPAVAHNAAAPKSVVVKTDPQASRVERWRAEQAAAEAARKDEAARLAAQPAEPETVASPVKAAATAASMSRSADASLAATDASAAEQPKAKSRKARTAEKARTKRLARDDVRPGRERTASNQQDDYYYGQRQGYAQQGFGQRQGYAQQSFGQRPASSAYAYAPQQSFGPFGGGGWGGRGW
jgi:membrane protein involved in colicin uptake